MTAVAKPLSPVARPAAGITELRLQCPQCGTFLGVLRGDQFPLKLLYSCTGCYFQMLNERGIWKALPPARAAHYAKFMREYQVVREAEGRGSKDPQYYLALPYQDLSGRNQEQWAIRARTYSFLEHGILPQIESRNGGHLNILDLGAGNGWLSFRLALRGHRPVAVDLLDADMDGLGAAAHYAHKLPSLFPRFQAELDRLPFADRQFDVAIFNASFHYSENYSATLSEAIRCLRSAGTVIIADTAWYKREESGQRMLAERHKAFVERYGFPSDGLASLEYLTDSRLEELADQFHLRWTAYSPFYGVHWAMRPLLAKLRRKREPSRFRIYVAEVVK
jgi:SAM-dependent methyltransferase